ncbi:MutS-related protein [Anaeromyxobacter diazotrophicus]|uniref:DNA mismatch repair protein n=1 Tax=Anaeromyxobacter diazotrophicus TaxID=2590199 RepID=A0A7I9VLL3_9BACT|nr:DNA mismatch repair protein MutS [Anaeromyxobacter diazotrophicus]GEJ57020.1 DNA mismatch repair protein [Anaeromyxobacter diazotrophicus]
MHDPRAILEARLGARRGAVAAWERRDARIAFLRLLGFAALTAVAVLSLALHRLSAWWLLAPGALFLALVVWHDRTLRRLTRARRAVAFHQEGLARLDGSWAGRGDGGERYAADDHPYAKDLDLFGRGSVFELLCTARTRPGADLLARWLLAPAPVAQVRARQGAAADLAPRLDLREDLAVLGGDARAELHPDRLAAWAELPRALPGWLALPALLAGGVALAALVGWFAGAVPGLAVVGVAAVEWLALRAAQGTLAEILGGVERPGAELLLLADLLARLEREPLEDARLRDLGAALGTGREAASARIRQLGRIVDRGGWADNQVFAPVAFLLLWRLQAALAVERWRAAHGRQVRAWLGAAAELEALSALGAHAFLHPGDPYPELLEPAGGARFEAEGLAHPLLHEGRAVRNDVRLGAGARLLIVSGSNMSGKSTLLRTVGVNTALALAGAPVRARRLALTPLQAGATLRIQDSLAEGRSRFYAEITRLRALLDLAAGTPPLLFLLDELLAGTNSRDRRIGAEAVLRTLLARGAVGLVTTHDLALSEAATALGEAANAHFEDEVHGGEVVFDYRLRPGVVTRSNALALMRAVGLEV